MTGKFKQFLLVSSVALATFSINAQAEQSLNQILTTIDTGSWTEVTNLTNFYSSTWNVAGTRLDFDLDAEQSSFFLTQSFSVQNNSMFNGSATPFLDLLTGIDHSSKIGDTASYTLTSSLSSSSFAFKTNFPLLVTEYNVYSIWFNATSNLYALAYEDSPNAKNLFGQSIPRDYNDMVVSFKVTPATPVPEASTTAMLGLGLGLVGWSSRRRRDAK